MKKSNLRSVAVTGQPQVGFPTGADAVEAQPRDPISGDAAVLFAWSELNFEF